MPKTDYDYIVVGSGNAGLNVALLARDHGSVLIITKGNIDDCNTRYAQGGIAAAVGPGDSVELHLRDTLSAGAVLCDTQAVEVLTADGPERVNNLMRWGAAFDREEGPGGGPADGAQTSQVALGREGAHSMARILYAGGDATGMHIELALTEQVARSAQSQSPITVLEHTLATLLIIEDGQVKGLETINSNTGQKGSFTGRFVVLATGGAGQLFRYTTNPSVATGDGVALAFRAGAQAMDMEFYQVHPTAFRMTGSDPFLMSEAVRGEGAVLRNQEGSACAAVHGANRLASNSLLDTLVFAQRVVDETLGLAPASAMYDAVKDDVDDAGNVYDTVQSRQLVCASMPELSVEALQDLMWRNVGISRNGTRLLLSARILNAWERTMPEATGLASHTLSNLLTVARLMVEGALKRQESRGAHYRMDFPETSESWQKHIILSL